MPRSKVIKLSSNSRRRNLVSSFNPSLLAIRVYKNCERSNTPNLCKVRGVSDKCVECARKSYLCDLAPFSPARWARIRRQRDAKL